MTKHILIIPSWYPVSPKDIGGSFFREQAIALKKRGYEVGVLAPQFKSLRDIKVYIKGPKGFSLVEDFGVKTLYYHSYSIPKAAQLNSSRWVSHGMALFERYVKLNGMPDIVHVHSLLNAGFLAQKIKIKFGCPYIITEHSSAFARANISAKTIDYLTPVVENSSENIAVSNEFCNLLENIFIGSKWRYIPNIVNGKFLEEVNVSSEESSYTFCNVCLLTENKKVNYLIEAFSIFSKKHSDVRLVIGGDGPEMLNLVSLADRLGCSDKIKFLGMLSRVEVLSVIKHSEAFVLSSEYETFGVVLVEALALGKPVIATRCGGPESIVNSEVGYLVEKNSVEELAKAMESLYISRDKFKAESIRKYCLENFSEKTVLDKLGLIYESVVSTN